MWLLSDLFKLMFAGPRAAWLFGNVRAIDAVTALCLPAFLGAVIGGGVVWYVARRRRPVLPGSAKTEEAKGNHAKTKLSMLQGFRRRY